MSAMIGTTRPSNMTGYDDNTDHCWEVMAVRDGRRESLSPRRFVWAPTFYRAREIARTKHNGECAGAEIDVVDAHGEDCEP